MSVTQIVFFLFFRLAWRQNNLNRATEKAHSVRRFYCRRQVGTRVYCIVKNSILKYVSPRRY